MSRISEITDFDTLDGGMDKATVDESIESRLNKLATKLNIKSPRGGCGQFVESNGRDNGMDGDDD